MPPPKVVTVIVRAVGARQAAREIRSVEKEVGKVDKAIIKLGEAGRRADAKISVFTRALFLMQLRMVNTAVSAGVFGAVLIALGPELLMLGSMVAALVASLIPLGFLLAGISDRFANTADIVGRPANRLKIALRDLQVVARRVIAPGADLVMSALADAIRTLMPLLKALEIPMMIFATYVAEAVKILTAGLLRGGPQIIALVSSLGSVMPALAEIVVRLGKLFLDMAQDGLPFLMRFLDWLSDVVSGKKGIGKFAEFLEVVQRTLREIGSTAIKVGEDMMPLLEAMANFFGWINDHWDTIGPFVSVLVLLLGVLWGLAIVGPILAPLGSAIVAIVGAIAGLSGASAIVAAVTAAVLALGAGLYFAWTQWEGFRNAVYEVWGALQGFWTWLTESVGNSQLFWAFEKIADAFEKISDFMARHPGFFGAKGSAGSGFFKYNISPLWGAQELLGSIGVGGAPATPAAPKATPYVPGASMPRYDPAMYGGVPEVFATVPVQVKLPDGTVLAEAIQKAILKAQSTR